MIHLKDNADARRAERGPLSGLKVVDLTTTFLGPYCTMLMSQMGADVLKLESPHGDVVRNVGPARAPMMSSVHMVVNSGKRSVVVDLTTEGGQKTLDALARNADVVVHNMRGQAAKRLNLTPERFAALNERIIFASASGYAEGSPNANRPAYDDIMQGEAGIAFLQGVRHGEPNYVSTIIADKTCALFLLSGILAALVERGVSGVGKSVHVPMYEGMASFVMLEHLYGMAFEPQLGPPGYPRVTSGLRRPYRTADGYISAMVYTDSQWRAFFTEVGREDLLARVDFQTMSSRNANIEELYSILESYLAQGTTAHWLEVFKRIDCPAGLVRSLEDLVADPHLVDSGIVQTYEHPSQGTVRGVGLPMQFGTDLQRPKVSGAPALGGHTAEVLLEHGYELSEIQLLAAEGAIVCGPR